MNQRALFSRPADTGPTAGLYAARPIVPMLEMAAYEALWMRQGMWFKELAKLFEVHEGALPSEIVDQEELIEAMRGLEAILPKVGQFDVRVNGAGEYPAKLREADHPVEVLYYKGDWELAHSRSVAIVGTREPSDLGVQHARRIAHALSREGFTIVSGLAKGIDFTVHTEVLRSKGATVAVIGTPLHESYPRENEALQRAIAAEHLLVSQVPFLRYAANHWKTNRLFFPARNVTMSAMTEATIIVEAGNTSGTLVQARAALNQKRKLFILEPCFHNPELKWPAKYEEQGAIRVSNVRQIIEALGSAPTV
ncbi:DNA-processing protein DprA [Pseudoxanthomonas mexicana]|uniref:DNA-processing protein DprA n=1 Tax=Pseudoxanthomonas mexicana TaxID=128785 RepID=UPI0024E2274B|nr:DNA-processing protein DprA [Pseudoxanthomonas mexicana]